MITAAPVQYSLHVLGEEVNLLAILISYNVSRSCSGVGTQNHSILEYDSDDRRSSLCSFWRLESIAEQIVISGR